MSTVCASALSDTTQGHLNLWLHHLPKGGAQEGLREVLDVFRDALPEQKHGQVLGEIVAIMQEEIVGLKRVLAVDLWVMQEA